MRGPSGLRKFSSVRGRTCMYTAKYNARVEVKLQKGVVWKRQISSRGAGRRAGAQARMPSFGAIKSLQKRCGVDRAAAKRALEEHADDEDAAATALGEIGSGDGTRSIPAASFDSEQQEALDSWAANEKAASVSVERQGTGDGVTFPERGDMCHVHYRGTLLAGGAEFDSSHKRGKPFRFKLGVGDVIKGWDVGIAQMSLGEKATLLIRSDYAYGPDGMGPIPSNADLRFECHLIEIERRRQPVA